MKRFFIVTIILSLATVSQAWAASCSVSEFSSLISDFGGKTIQIVMVPTPSPITQVVTPTVPAAVSNAFASGTRFLWIYCDEVVHMQLGTSPATGLTSSDFRIPSGGFWIGLPSAEANLGTLKIAFCDIDCA